VVGENRPQAILKEVMMKTADVLETAAEETAAYNTMRSLRSVAGHGPESS
jgi:hypothetical protein